MIKNLFQPKTHHILSYLLKNNYYGTSMKRCFSQTLIKDSVWNEEELRSNPSINQNGAGMLEKHITDRIVAVEDQMKKKKNTKEANQQITRVKQEISFEMAGELLELSEEQEKIVFSDLNDDLLVLGCAGSGKTTTIICKIIYMIKYLNIPQDEIVYATFSRMAARDVKKRLLDMLKTDKTTCTIGTIESFAYSTLKKYRNVYIERFEKHSLTLRDLLKEPNELSLADEICSKTKYLFIDEYHDIGYLGTEIVNEYHKRGCKIIAIGDDAQNIYSWRGSSAQHVLNFHSIYPNSKILTLTRNYRSSPEIIHLANALLRNNVGTIPNEMKIHRESNQLKPIYINADALNVAEMILSYIKRGVPMDRIAILSPTNYGLKKKENRLKSLDIPYILVTEKANALITFTKHNREGKVYLSTIYKAKGLEWDIVFLVDSSDDEWRGDSDVELRRLLHFAITRARNELFIIRSKNSSFLSYFTEPNVDGSLFIPYSKLGKPSDNPILKSFLPNNPFNIINMVHDSIDPNFIRMLKEIIPSTTTILNSTVSYCEIVKENQMIEDFNNFIKVLFYRMISERMESEPITHNSTELLLSESIILNSNHLTIYNRHSNLLKQFMRCEKRMPFYWVSIDYYEADICNQIITKYKKALERGVSLENIPVFGDFTFPKGYLDNLTTTFEVFKNKNYESVDILNSVFEISKLDAIVKEKRLRMIYIGSDYLNKKFDFMKDIAPNYTELFNNMKNYITPYVLKHIVGNSSCTLNRTFSYRKHVNCDTDIIINNDTIIDIKCSISQDIEIEWILQLFGSAAIARVNGRDIKRVGIINPLLGTYHQIDISQWDKGNELLEILYQRTKDRVEKVTNMIFEEDLK